MTSDVQFGPGYMGRLPHGADLLEALTQLCVEKAIQLGRVEAIGAVQRARIGFYDQTTHEYTFMTFDQSYEILNLTGNVSLRDGKPMIHAHITLSDHEGRSFGGHLAPGTIVFACEFILQRIEGAALKRGFDEETGLPLWQP
ncbi:MAG: DNA-binding protein [Lentisphaerae bacterium]|nr:DNA-binding protein [Lentisphaerota bacterium]